MPSGRKDPEALLQEANDLYERGEWKGTKRTLVVFFKVVPTNLASKPILAEGHILMAQVKNMMTELRDAEDHCKRAMAIGKEINDKGILAKALRWYGNVKWKRSDYKGALEEQRKALELAREIKDEGLVGILHIEISIALSELGDNDKAERELREAILALERAGDKHQLARAYNNLGDNFMGRRQFDKATHFFEKSRKVGEKYGNLNMAAFASFNKAECLFELGKYEEALSMLDWSLPMLEEIGDKYGQAGANQIYGLVYAKMGQWHKAEEYMIKARRLAQKSAMPVSEAKIIRDIGRIYKWRGDKDKAKLYLIEARDIFKKHQAAGDLERVKKDLEDIK